MKNFVFVLCLVFWAGTVYSAEYPIKPGDNLGAIAIKLKVSQIELEAMNNITAKTKLKIGRRLSYFEPEDIDMADDWCWRNIAQMKKGVVDMKKDTANLDTLGVQDLEKKIKDWENAEIDVRHGNFRFVDEGINGIYFKLVESFAEAERAQREVTPPH